MTDRAWAGDAGTGGLRGRLRGRLALLFAVAIACCQEGSSFGQRGLTAIPPPDPEAERAAMTVADGYEVNLFAADPLIRKPLQINFDPAGRLWVSSSSIYPQIRPGEVANDTVTILEDRDGDGRADSSTVFADGLLMPTGVLPGPLVPPAVAADAAGGPSDAGAGAFVANSTELLHLSDSDGDGRADRRRVVLSGFGAEDTHHIIHTFRWGPDGRFYFNQSIYIHSHVETPTGVKRLNGGGIWRFRPESLALEVFARGWVNAWGHAFDPWGRSLVTDGAGGEGISYGFPGAAYQAAVGSPRILHGMNPGSPKYCGLERVDGGHMPEEARGLLVTNDFRANRVCRFRLAESGSGFRSEKLPDLIHSSRVTFRPIDAKMGPDGALYIADWYNPIIQHGEVDFRDDRRDRVHGRIWRVTAKARPTLRRIDFTTLSTPELLDHLGAEDGYAREMSRRVLLSRGLVERLGTAGREPAAGGAAPGGVRAAIAPHLGSLAKDSPDFERIRLEMLWLRQGLDTGAEADVDRGLLGAVLGSKEPRARAAACRAACDWADRLEDPLALLAPLVDDGSMLVRLEAVRAVSALGLRFPDQAERAAAAVLRAVDHPRDDALDYATWLASRELSPAWVPALLAGRFEAAQRPARVIYGVEAAGAREAVAWIVGRMRSGDLPPEDVGPARACIARLGGPDDLSAILSVAMSTDIPPSEAAALLGRLLEAHATARTVPSGDLSVLSAAIDSQDPALAAKAIEAAGRWRVGSLAAAIGRIAAAADSPRGVRVAAVGALGMLPGPDAAESLRAIATRTGDRPADAGLAAEAIRALVPREPAAAAGAAVRLLESGPDARLQSSIFRSFLASKGGAGALAAAIRARRSLPAAAARSGLAEVSAAGRPEPELAAELERVVSAADPGVSQRHAMGPEALEAFGELVRTRASAARGEAIYRREALRCVACHRVGREGGRVGPDLTAIGASSQLDYLIDSLVHPAKNVKEGYSTLVIQSLDGRVVAGIPLTRSSEEVVLRDATNREVRIRIADIEEESAGTSLMPAGLVDALSREELADLVRYLSELGRAGEPSGDGR
jgi:putative heme-binding domain-containing protein